jgi:hypothetical protein
MMPLNENNNLNTHVVSPYQIFMLYIRSPKTIKEYSIKFDKFFNFLINTLGETDFKTDGTETKYLLLYTTAKNNINWFNSILYKYIQFQKNRVKRKVKWCNFCQLF